MSQTKQIKIFTAIVFILFINNLLVTNSTIEWWAPETANLTTLENGIPNNLPSLILTQLSEVTSDKFVLRLPGILILFLTFLGIFNLGKRVFGQKTILYTLLVLASSILLPNISKFATSDIWLFSAQTFTALAMILFLKQPIQRWKMIGFGALFLGVLVNPISMLVFTSLMGGLLFFIHPKGKNLQSLWIWSLPFLIGFGSKFLGIFNFTPPPTEFISLPELSIYKYVIIIFLGTLPWFIFFPSGIWNMVKRLRQKEELAVITFSWMMGSLFSISLAAQVVFALIIAKQLQGFFDKNFPYGNMVKSSALMHLGVILFGAIYLIIISWENLKAEGFRAAMVSTLFYWMGCLLAFIGLYGPNKKIILGGLAFAGLLVSHFFWTKAFGLFF